MPARFLSNPRHFCLTLIHPLDSLTVSHLFSNSHSKLESTLAQSRCWALSCQKEVHPLFSGLLSLGHQSSCWNTLQAGHRVNTTLSALRCRKRETQLTRAVMIFNKWLLRVHSLRGCWKIPQQCVCQLVLNSVATFTFHLKLCKIGDPW